jgi:hypothetical protein
MKSLHHGSLVFALCAALAVSAAAARTEPRNERGPASVAGAWRVTLLGLGPAPIPILMTFGRDGTLLQTDTPVLLPQPVPPSSAASNGHGLWRQTGSNEFSFTYVKIFYGPEGPALATVTQQARGSLSSDGKTFTANIVSTDFVNADGSPVPPGGVASISFEAKRIELP